MHSIMYSVIYVCRNVSTFGEEKKSVTGTLSATVPRITQFFFLSYDASELVYLLY